MQYLGLVDGFLIKKILLFPERRLLLLVLLKEILLGSSGPNAVPERIELCPHPTITWLSDS